MSKIRVYELAKKLKKDSKLLIEELKKEGIEVKSHMSTIDKETSDLILEVLSESRKVKKKEEKLKKKDVTHQIKEKEEIPTSTQEKRLKKIQLSEAITVKEIAEKLNVQPNEIIKKLMAMGIIATINQVIDIEAVRVIAKNFGFEAEIYSIEREETFQEEKEDPSLLIPRPPVVTIMGHVDHGKTLLLDVIRKTNVIGKEAGGITQQIGAYKVEIEKGEIVFLDTPGHEAFTSMRARGAQVTDIVVLVVAADDGVMPQTEEAINHAEAAQVPIIVAINKIDKPNANIEKVKKDLMKFNLVPEEWGGQTIFVETSAKKRTGIENLLEMILLQAEVLELRANPKRLAKGIVIESKLDKGRGPVATVLIQNGTLKEGQSFIAGLNYGKVRALINDRGKKIKEAGPSTPVEVLGLSGVPLAGDSFVVVSDERKARQIGILRQTKQREEGLAKTSKVTLDDLYTQIQKGDIKELNILIKGDTHGSVQALKDSLEKLSTKDIILKIVHGAVGGITESDVMLSSASNAIIIGFNVRPTPKASEFLEKEKLDMRIYTVIYDAINDVKAAIKGLLEPKFKERMLGRAEIREVFNIPKIGPIAGSHVTQGIIKRGSETRLLRDNVIIYQGRIESLRRFKEDANEVQSGYECGIGIENFQDIKVGDIIETFFYEKVK
ncbi:MAG TPA: translation initiation factor IF-2 [Nitrospinota bacterium]|nr:translation initiation factor IF-2 [Nitrospinota bacterium]